MKPRANTAGKVPFPARSRRLLSRNLVLYLPTAEGAVDSRLLGEFPIEPPATRVCRSAVYSSLLKQEVVFIFSYISAFFFRVFGHFEKPLFFELCKYIQTKFVPANTLLFRPGQVCFNAL